MSCCLKFIDVINEDVRNFLINDIGSQQQFSRKASSRLFKYSIFMAANNLSIIFNYVNVLFIGEYKNKRIEGAVEMLKQVEISNVSSLCGGPRAWSNEN